MLKIQRRNWCELYIDLTGGLYICHGWKVRKGHSQPRREPSRVSGTVAPFLSVSDSLRWSRFPLFSWVERVRLVLQVNGRMWAWRHVWAQVKEHFPAKKRAAWDCGDVPNPRITIGKFQCGWKMGWSLPTFPSSLDSLAELWKSCQYEYIGLKKSDFLALPY